METYQHDFARLKQAFVEFLQNLPFYGSAVLCADDPNVREIMPLVSKPMRHLRLRAPTRWCAPRTSSRDGGRMRFRASARRRRQPLDVTLNLPGRAQRAERAGGDRRRRARSASPTRRSSRRWRSSAASAGASSATATCALPRAAAASRWSTTTATTRRRWRRRWPRRAARFPGGAWCSRSSRTATRARATCSRTSCAVLSTVDALLLAEVYPGGRGADRRRRRPRARARGARRRQGRAGVRRGHRARCRDAIRRVARDGDVVLDHGRGLDRRRAGAARAKRERDGHDRARASSTRRCAASCGATSRWRGT